MEPPQSKEESHSLPSDVDESQEKDARSVRSSVSLDDDTLNYVAFGDVIGARKQSDSEDAFNKPVCSSESSEDEDLDMSARSSKHLDGNELQYMAFGGISRGRSLDMKAAAEYAEAMDDMRDESDEGEEDGDENTDEYMYHHEEEDRKRKHDSSNGSCTVHVEELEPEDHVTKSHYIPRDSRDQCRACATSFLSPLARRPHHCRRCGDVFCRPCLIHRKRLNVWAQPDAKGILCKVCINCYEETETVLFGVKRSVTDYFVGLRKQCKTERRHILCDVTLERRNARTVPAVWREQLSVDIAHECQRLLDGFRVAVGPSDTHKTLHELTDKYIVPAWQKAKFWTLEHSTLRCRGCNKKLKGQKYRNCRVCALALCRKCSLKELLVYYEDGQPPGRGAEPRLAIIKVVGSPEKEPRYSLRLPVCGLCREEMVRRQTADPRWYSRLSRPPDPDLMDRVLEMDHTFRRLNADLHHDVDKLEEITEIQKYPSPTKDSVVPETGGETDNTINSYQQEIAALQEKVQRSLETYYELYQGLKTAVSSLGKTARDKQLKLATNYIQARKTSYFTFRSKASVYKLTEKPA